MTDVNLNALADRSRQSGPWPLQKVSQRIS